MTKHRDHHCDPLPCGITFWVHGCIVYFSVAEKKKNMTKATYFDLWFQWVKFHTNRNNMTTGSSHGNWNRKLSVHILNCKHEAERANCKCCQFLNSQSLPQATHFIQQGHTPLTSPNSTMNQETSVQIHEPLGDIFIQTIARSSFGSFCHGLCCLWTSELPSHWLEPSRCHSPLALSLS